MLFVVCVVCVLFMYVVVGVWCLSGFGGAVGAMDSVSDFESGGCGFESRIAYYLCCVLKLFIRFCCRIGLYIFAAHCMAYYQPGAWQYPCVWDADDIGCMLIIWNM